MNEEKGKKLKWGRECAYIAVFVALLLVAQLCFSFIAGIELVTVLFVAYSFTFGWERGVISAVAFSLLRQLVFGFFPHVLCLYLLYYPLLTLVFGLLGKDKTVTLKALFPVILFACLGTLVFCLLDLAVAALWLHLTGEAFKVYALASLPVALTQLACTAVTVGGLFLPLHKAFSLAKKGLS